MISLSAFSLAFISSPGMGMFALCHCILEVCNFLFYFMGTHGYEIESFKDRVSVESSNSSFRIMLKLLRFGILLKLYLVQFIF